MARIAKLTEDEKNERRKQSNIKHYATKAKLMYAKNYIPKQKDIYKTISEDANDMYIIINSLHPKYQLIKSYMNEII